MSNRIFLVGDIHIGLGFPNKADKWFNVHKEYFSNFLIPLLKREVKLGDIIVLLGDLFDDRDIIPIHLMNYAMSIIEEMSLIAPVHILVGNHDLWSKSASEINSIRPFKYIPNVHIYDSTRVLVYNGLNILMMPYIDKKVDQIKQIQENKNCDYLFCHSDLNGCKMHLTSVAHRNLNKIDIEDFKSFKRVMSGHIHLVQKNKQFTFVGSIFQMDRNDYNNQKGIFIVDTDDDSEVFIPNNISPVFMKVNVNEESDINNLDSLINSKDYIDISISSKLLVDSRKLRRKIEGILEVGNFESVDYINDIVNENDKLITESIENDLEDVNITHNDLLPYIKNYIVDSEYNSESFRKGILDEFDKINDIYNKSYKTLE